MQKGKNVNVTLDGLPNGRELRVERRFASERNTRNMLQNLIRIHMAHM